MNVSTRPSARPRSRTQSRTFGRDEFKPTEDTAGLTSVGDPFSEQTFSESGRIAYAEAQFDRVIYDEDREAVVAVEDAVREAVEPVGVTVEYNGEAEFPPIEQGTSELLGLLAAIIVLLIVFRTFVAAFIPIVLAIAALATAFLLLFILAGLTDINTITPILVTMIGLGVGIDYSLFIVTRFRQLLHEGLSPVDAASEAGASAGRAVLFAGLTVAIGVSGLAFFGLDFVTKLGIGSALGVLTTVLLANSLLIAVLRLLGHKIDRLKIPFLPAIDDSEEAREKTLVARWGRFVTRNARFVFPVVLLLMLALAATSGLVRLGVGDQGTQPKEQTARRAYDLLAEGFGPGFNGPIPIVVDVNGDAEAPQRIFDGVQGLDGVASVGEPQLNDAKTVGIVFVTPDTAPQAEATDNLVDRLRSDVVPAAVSGGDAVAYVSGQTAAFKDIGDRIMERAPLFLLYIIGVTFLVLAMAFRSIVVSLTAAITTILSAFVGFGVLTLVVQEGHLLGLTGLDRTGPIETFIPPIAFAILFGLSMDYMVFLMSRVREEHVHGLATRDALDHGIAAIGRVVVAAAVIMGTVFAAFILSGDRVSKEFGILLAIAILVDALIVRMTLVPAFFTLLGEKTWYIPGWFDRLLPKITVESPHEGETRPVVEPTPAAEPLGREQDPSPAPPNPRRGRAMARVTEASGMPPDRVTAEWARSPSPAGRRARATRRRGRTLPSARPTIARRARASRPRRVRERGSRRIAPPCSGPRGRAPREALRP